MDLAKGMNDCGSGRILLYGPPGTGKTAYAKALAKMLDKPLLERRASDLLSPWVGETEQRIDQAFTQALEEDALLFIDEADSLLYRRETAVRHWEVSQVNELLEQLQDFTGVVVLATNRLEALDAAVLRRMDAKLRFDGLTPEQVAQGVLALCTDMVVKMPVCGDVVVAQGETATATNNARQLTVASLSAIDRLASTGQVTPGDLGVVARRLVLAGWPRTRKAMGELTELTELAELGQPDGPGDPSQLDQLASLVIQLLGAELALKSGGRAPMEFTAGRATTAAVSGTAKTSEPALAPASTSPSASTYVERGTVTPAWNVDPDKLW